MELEFFRPRGIGGDSTPGCFVCGGEPGYRSNISGFVESKEAGEHAVAMFTQGARLDWRANEPDWIQVKVGACPAHVPNLEMLYRLTCNSHLITPGFIKDAINLVPETE